MAYFAVIDNGVVINTIVAESKETAELVTSKTCVEILFEPGQPCIGWTYDGAEFTAPVVEETE
jgi:hypothetical protein